jgi:RNA recognition motif-containing protein
MAVRLFVGNLSYDVTEAELRAHFAAIGPLLYLSLATDRDTGKPRGFAFVEFSARADAEDAIRRFNNQAFKGRPLAVNEARPDRCVSALETTTVTRRRWAAHTGCVTAQTRPSTTPYSGLTAVRECGMNH